jgi:hypothetical protein
MAIYSILMTQLSNTEYIKFPAFTILISSHAQPAQNINSSTTGESDSSLINNTQGAGTSEASLREEPDNDCLFNPSLPKCAPIEGKCPSGFLMNENEQCFPDKPCPAGFTKFDEDETGTCYPVSHLPTPPLSARDNFSSGSVS